MLGASVEAAFNLHVREVRDDEPAIIGTMTDDFMIPDVSGEKLLELRIDEIMKVDQSDGFEAVPRTAAGAEGVITPLPPSAH